jgi:hypothetical protein
MIGLTWLMSTALQRHLRTYMPSNILLERLRTGRGLMWSPLVGFVLAAGYLVVASFTTEQLAAGGPGWLNLLVLICIWDAMKFAAMGMVGPALILKAMAFRARSFREHRQGRFRQA